MLHVVEQLLRRRPDTGPTAAAAAAAAAHCLHTGAISPSLASQDAMFPEE